MEKISCIVDNSRWEGKMGKILIHTTSGKKIQISKFSVLNAEVSIHEADMLGRIQTIRKLEVTEDEMNLLVALGMK